MERFHVNPSLRMEEQICDRSSSQRVVLGTALYEIFEKYFETPSRLTLNTHWK